MRLAEAGLDALQQVVDTLIVIPNQNLFRLANEKTTFADAFKMADDVLHSGVRGITDLMVMPGLVNLDFADIRTVMMEMGKAMMGTGEAEGENRAVVAAEAAISNPLLDDVSMKGARGVLINITGSKDMTLFEIDEAANRIREEVDPDANIIFGSTFDDSVQGKIRISIVATGIDAAPRPTTKPIDHAGRAPISAAAPASTPHPSAGYAHPQAYASQHTVSHNPSAGGYGVAPQGVVPHHLVFMTPPPVRADVRAEVVPPRLETVSAPEPIAATPAVVVNSAPRGDASVALSSSSSPRPTSGARDSAPPLSPSLEAADAASAKPSLFGRLAQTVSGKPGKGDSALPHRPQSAETSAESSKMEAPKSPPPPALDEDLEIPAFLRRK
jgi:cell division protein FtsZ